MRKTTTTKKVETKRGVGRPKMDTAKDMKLNFRASSLEAQALKELARDTKADNMTAVIRNLITWGVISLQKNSLAQNKIFYERFSSYWDAHLYVKDYSDLLGEMLKK